MTQALTTSSGTTAQPQPAAETIHLRRFIEKQPACILRVGLDAALLAVNEAALGLIGAEQLAQVLGTKLTRFITPRQQDEWEEFARRVQEGTSASIECDLTDMSGTRRTILLQGVPLLDHPDGAPSMILSARDISAPRRLEMALREREVSRELEDLQRQLERGVVERQQLSASLSEREANHQQLVDEHEAEQARLRQTLTEQHELVLMLKEQEGRQLLDALRADLEQALAEGQRLAALLASREAEQQRAAAVHAADRAQLQQALAEEHQLALILKERETRGLIDSLKAELDKSVAERQQLAASFDERETHHQRALSEQQAEREQLQRILDEERQLLQKEREARQLLDTFKEQLDASLGERERLAASLAEREATYQRETADHHAERERLQQTLAEERQQLLKEQEARRELELLRSDLEQLQAERQKLEIALAERDAEHQRIVAEQMAELAQRRVLAEEQQAALAQREKETQQQLDGVRDELEQALSDRQRLVGLLDDREADHQRLLSDHEAARMQAERKLEAALLKQAEVEKTFADLRIELQSVDENARNLEWLATAGRAAREIGRELQTVIEAVDARTKHLLAQSSVGSGDRHVIESLRGDAIGAASLVRQIVRAGEGSSGEGTKSL